MWGYFVVISGRVREQYQFDIMYLGGNLFSVGVCGSGLRKLSIQGPYSDYFWNQSLKFNK